MRVESSREWHNIGGKTETGMAETKKKKKGRLEEMKEEG